MYIGLLLLQLHVHGIHFGYVQKAPLLKLVLIPHRPYLVPVDILQAIDGGWG